MIIGTFLTPNGPRYGLVIRDQWLDIPEAALSIGEHAPDRLVEFVAEGNASIERGNRLQLMAEQDPDNEMPCPGCEIDFGARYPHLRNTV